MGNKFTDILNARQKKQAHAQKLKDAVVKPFLELTPEQQEKLEGMMGELLDLDKKKYSELTLNQKRLVEMFCSYSSVDSNGTSNKDLPKDKQYKVLIIGAYPRAFISRGLKMLVTAASIGPKTLTIYADENINIQELYGKTFKPTGSPFHDALNSYPDYYLPTRDYKGRASIFAVWPPSGKGSSQSDWDKYVYKEREAIRKAEDTEQLYKLPAYLPESKEEPKEHIAEPVLHELIQEYIECFEKAEITERIANIVLEYEENPIDYFKNLIGEEFKPRPAQHKILLRLAKDSQKSS